MSVELTEQEIRAVRHIINECANNKALSESEQDILFDVSARLFATLKKAGLKPGGWKCEGE